LNHEGFLVGEVGGPDRTGVILTVEGVEQAALLLLVGKPFEAFQQDNPGSPQQVDLPAPAILGLADRAPLDLMTPMNPVKAAALAKAIWRKKRCR